jgi:hypothetical protein
MKANQDMTKRHINIVARLSFFICLVLFTLPAQALTFKAVVKGTFFSGEDLTGVFGFGTNSNLTGRKYDMTYVYDLGKDGIFRSSYLDSAEQAYFGTASPIVSASFSVNGVTEQIAGQTYGQVAISSYPNLYFPGSGYSNFIQYTAGDQFWSGSLVTTKIATMSYNGFFDNLPIPGNLETPYSYDMSSLPFAGQFSHAIVDTSTNGYLLKTDGILIANNIKVSAVPVSAVPLPATLPLLAVCISGLAFLGRRRTR